MARQNAPVTFAEQIQANGLETFRKKQAVAPVDREILRVVATIPAYEEEDMFLSAQHEVLRWARNRAAGGELPAEAWNGQAFESLIAGRTTMAALVSAGESSLWSLRVDDPDKNVAGRIWSTEISLGRTGPSQNIRLGVRLLVNSDEPELVIEPAVPGLVRQIVERCGLNDGQIPVRCNAHRASEPGHVSIIVEWLFMEARRLPVIIATGDERGEHPEEPKIDVDRLAKALCGLAHVVSVPAHLTFGLSDALGKSFAVFHGGIRVYEPGINFLDDPRDHRLILGRVVERQPDVAAAELRRGIAKASLRRTRLGHDVLSFAAVRSAAARAQNDRPDAQDAADRMKLATATMQIDALSREVSELQSQVDHAWILSQEESARADTSEKQLYASWARISALGRRLISAEPQPY